MKQMAFFSMPRYKSPAVYAQVQSMIANKQLRDFEEQLELVRLDETVDRLKKLGFWATCKRVQADGEEMYFPYICVSLAADTYSLAASELGEKTNRLLAEAGIEPTWSVWATRQECERLFDMKKNLPHADAFARWTIHVEDFEVEKYTRADAIRDTRNARVELQQQLNSGEINTQTYRDLYPSTSFMDLAQ